MTEQLHITQCDDPTYLPFAKTRIKAMRATGQKFLSQKFDVGGVRVDVRIEGEHSFVSISGGEGWYSIYPTSKEHPDGVRQVITPEGETISVTPFAVARPDGSTRAHKEYVTGRFDWVSYDGVKKDGTVKYGKHLITFDGDTDGRYPQVHDPIGVWTSLHSIIIDGKPAYIEGVVSGIALTRVALAGETSKKDYVIYASVEFITPGVTTANFFALPYKSAVSAPPTAAPVAIGSINVAGRVRQPFYFDGRGEKFVTYANDPPTGTANVIVHGTIGFDGSSFSVSATFETFATAIASQSSDGGPVDPFLGGSSTSTSSGGSRALFGADLSAAGETRLLTSRFITYSTATTSAVGYMYGGSGAYSYTATAYSLTTLLINETEVYSAGTSVTQRNTLSASSVLDERSTYTTHRGAAFDVDARYYAAVWVAYYRSRQLVSILTDFSYSLTNKLLPSTMTIHTRFGDDHESKIIRVFDGDNTVPAGGLEGLAQVDYPQHLFINMGAKLFATRNAGSYMFCASLPLGHYPEYAAYFQYVNLEPLVMRKTSTGTAKPINHEKLGVADDTEIWHFPITLIHSLSAVKL